MRFCTLQRQKRPSSVISNTPAQGVTRATHLQWRESFSIFIFVTYIISLLAVLLAAVVAKRVLWATYPQAGN
ncbi:hypothetical protein CPELA_01555 [Corynebacterium pelargi]|uniref:Uncharacterized protein n=1 Tax=Corynebacterium pelargi TaxID=1471400 RepID=A0A410W6P2_9CORY|nr:hypothetical protein CPELA_01555 [Corynebacterium pelargi]